MTQWGTATLTYDLNANMLSNGTDGYTWDARNRLVSTLSGASFQYDPFGRRVSKTVSGATTSFLYDGANVVQELMGGTPTANLLTGLGVDEVFTRTDAVGARHFLTDALGSTLALTDPTGSVLTQYSYEPFGNTTLTGPATTNSFAYTGRELDATGLYFYRARYYNPTLQRFISGDPLDFSGGDANLYAYVRSDPTDRIDPFGLFWIYKQSTGQMFYQDDQTGDTTLAGTGYAGHNAGLNNPDYQSVPGDPNNPENTDAGPLPQGNYAIGPQQDNRSGNGTNFRQSMRLTPDPGNNMFGRAGFLIHGSNDPSGRSSSQGCIILPPNVRKKIGGSPDKRLKVVP